MTFKDIVYLTITIVFGVPVLTLSFIVLFEIIKRIWRNIFK